MKMRYKLRHEDDMAPCYSSKGAAGIDIYYNGGNSVELAPGIHKEFETHLSVEIPEGHFGMLVVRSGHGWRGLSMLNSVGIIDEDYRGEIGIKLINHGYGKVIIEPKERIAQLIILPYTRVEFEQVDELSDTERGAGSFGSTGVK